MCEAQQSNRSHLTQYGLRDPERAILIQLKTKIVCKTYVMPINFLVGVRRGMLLVGRAREVRIPHRALASHVHVPTVPSTAM